MQLFYDPDLREGTYELRAEEARHAARVLRKRTGDVLDLTDGRGGWFRGKITDIDKRTCWLDVSERARSPARADHRLTLLVAPTKNIDRFEFLLEKVTEIGIDEIRPFFSDHSERTRLRTDRLDRVLESAMKQSLRSWMPRLHEPVNLRDALESVQATDRYLAYLGSTKTPLLRDQSSTGQDLVVAIGPEGGFSPEEAAFAREAGYQWVSLGPHRLRTETAAIAAVHALESARWPASN